MGREPVRGVLSRLIGDGQLFNTAVFLLKARKAGEEIITRAICAGFREVVVS